MGIKYISLCFSEAVDSQTSFCVVGTQEAKIQLQQTVFLIYWDLTDTRLGLWIQKVGQTRINQQKENVNNRNSFTTK